MDSTPKRKWYPMEEAAKVLGISSRTIRRAIRQDRIEWRLDPRPNARYHYYVNVETFVQKRALYLPVCTHCNRPQNWQARREAERWAKWKRLLKQVRAGKTAPKFAGCVRPRKPHCPVCHTVLAAPKKKEKR